MNVDLFNLERFVTAQDATTRNQLADMYRHEDEAIPESYAVVKAMEPKSDFLQSLCRLKFSFMRGVGQ